MASGSERLLVDGREVARLLLADTAPARLRGMLLRRPLPPALLLSPASSVHGLGMVETLEVALLDRDMCVRHLLRLRPCGMTRPRRQIRSVLEAPVGSFEQWGLRVGSQVAIAERGTG